MKSQFRLFTTFFATLLIVSACANDGRELKAPGPGQGESIAILTTTTEPSPDVISENVFSVTGTWIQNGALDPRHTCKGANISPALTIANVPEGTKSLAITLFDVINPQQPLWVVANIDPTSNLIKEGGIPDGAIAGAGFNGDKILDGYNGPCVADKEIHEFVLTVSALDQLLEFTPEPMSLSSSQLLAETIQASAFAVAETRFLIQNP